MGTLQITKNRDEIGWNGYKVLNKGGLYDSFTIFTDLGANLLCNPF
jgi:hypothetical protein